MSCMAITFSNKILFVHYVPFTSSSGFKSNVTLHYLLRKIISKYERLWPSFTFTWDEQIRPFKKAQILYFTPPFFLLGKFYSFIIKLFWAQFLSTISLKPHNHNHWFIAYYMDLWNGIWQYCKKRKLKIDFNN